MEPERKEGTRTVRKARGVGFGGRLRGVLGGGCGGRDGGKRTSEMQGIGKIKKMVANQSPLRNRGALNPYSNLIIRRMKDIMNVEL